MASTRKVLSVGVSAACLTGVALSMGVVTASEAVAAPRPTAGPVQPQSGGVDATDYKLSCGTVSGKVSFSPPLTMSGGQGSLTVTLKGKIGNCTATPPPAGGPAVTISSGKFSGSFVSPVDPGCPGLLGTSQVQGSMTMKFKTAAGTPKLTSGASTVQLVEIMGSQDPVGDVFTDFPGVGAKGSFQGTDSGFFDIFHASDGAFDIFVKKCSTANGLSSFKLQAGSTVNLG